VPDGTGAYVVFSQRTEKGIGLFLTEISTGKKHLLAEQGKENEAPIRPLGWSPDGALFAYSARTVDPKDNKRKDAIAICSGSSGQTIATIFWTVNELAWLTPDSFVFSQNDHKMMRVQRLSETKWAKPKPLDKAEKDKADKDSKPAAAKKLPYSVRNLIATSTTSIAWQSGNKIWGWDVNSEKPAVLWQSGTNTLVGFSFCAEKGVFLLHLHEAQGDSAVSYDPLSGEKTDLGRIGSADERLANLIWINRGAGYAYLLDQHGRYVPFARQDSSQPATELFAGSHVNVITGGGTSDRLVSRGDCLYTIACFADEPPGVLEFNASSATLRCVASSRDHVFTHARCAEISSGLATNSQGRVLAYHLWQPVHFERGKKYPLLIGQTPFLWSQCAEVAANLGAYYVTVDRPTFVNSQLGDWADDVMSAYRQLILDPNVDAGNVFLYGTSAETGYATELLATEPTLWKGAVLFSPVAFPDPARTRVENILLDHGQDDVFVSEERIKQFQDEAWQNGISVTIAVETAGHMFTSSSANQGRVRQFAQFLVGTDSIQSK